MKAPAPGKTGPDHENSVNNAPSAAGGKEKSRSLSMHEEVPVWYDCCSCEAEPYWEEALAEQSSKEKE